MKFFSTLVVLATLSVFTEALHHEHVQRSSHHNRIMRRGNNTLNRRCKLRPTQSQDDQGPPSSSTPPPSPSPSPAPNTSPNTGGLIRGPDNSCGSPGAVQQVTQTAGPNGDIDWMNCGVEGDGWNPPHVEISDLVTVDLDYAISQGGPFTPCSDYVWAFKQFGDQFGLPPILLASIALQESTCNPGAVGGNGEQGLMQLTHDKCGNAPGGNCQDVGYNVMTGAQYFSSQLAANGNSFFLTLGSYNGWTPGMTVGSATSQRYTNCHAQNNLDYLCQTVNGWMLNNNAYAMGIGKYHNLDGC